MTYLQVYTFYFLPSKIFTQGEIYRLQQIAEIFTTRKGKEKQNFLPHDLSSRSIKCCASFLFQNHVLLPWHFLVSLGSLAEAASSL